MQEPLEFATEYRELRSSNVLTFIRDLIVPPAALLDQFARTMDHALKKPRVQFLYSHHILADEEEGFRQLLRTLAKDHTFISYSEAVERVRSGNIDKPYVSFSFDDGMQSCLRAAEILDEFGAKACFFLPVSIIGETDDQKIAEFCMDRLEIYPVRFLNWDEVDILIQNGHEIGSHTATHPMLSKLNEEEIREEVALSYEILKERVGEVKHFAWPFGRFHHFSAEAARVVYDAGFETIASAERGCHIEQTSGRDFCIHRTIIQPTWPLRNNLFFLSFYSRIASMARSAWPMGWREKIGMAPVASTNGNQPRHDFVVLSSQDWDGLPTRKHRWAEMWAAEGHRVLYVEQQMHWAGWLVDIRNQFSRAWRWRKGPREIAPNLWLFTLPIVLPFFQMSAALNWINNLSLVPLVRRQLAKLGFDNPILWSYTPHSGDFVGKLGEKLAVYECVDEFSASKGLVRSKTIKRLEGDLISKSDHTIVTAHTLYESKKAYAQRITLAPNAAEVPHFNKAADPNEPVKPELANLHHPVLGFLGAIQYWVDVKLLARIARQHPEWPMALVGPPGLLVDLSELERLPNVHLTGRVPYQELPGYLRAFDVCLNPYVMDGVAEGCSPIKLYEYLATGKPIVSMNMPEVMQFQDLLYIAEDADGFVEQVEQAVADLSLPDAQERAKQRLNEAQNHTWRGRFDDVNQALNETLAELGIA